MLTVSVVTACYNEEASVRDVYDQVKAVFNELDEYAYEHIFVDNNSTDNTIKILKEIAEEDKNVKLIINVRNFGHIRSPYYGLLQANGDAVIRLSADLQDPPELIKDFIKKWREGFRVVIGIKNRSDENSIMVAIRKSYYNLIERWSETDQIKNFTGFGLYDREFIESMRSLNESYPYFRGLITDIGFERAEVEFLQPKRKSGRSKNNFYVMYDVAMLGFVSHSKVPLRIAAFIGFSVAILSLIVLTIYILWKVFYWQEFQLGMAPLIIGVFFFSAVQLFFIGVIGEYVGSIYTEVKNRPLVIEKERINFNSRDAEKKTNEDKYAGYDSK